MKVRKVTNRQLSLVLSRLLYYHSKAFATGQHKSALALSRAVTAVSEARHNIREILQ
jgi:hypothetical protein